MLRLAWGIVQAWSLIGRLKPAVAVGFGGYPTLPPMLAAARRGVPTVIHEQNAVIGRANGFLAPRVTAIATSQQQVRGTEKVAPKIVQTGNPVRPAVLAAAETPYPALAADGPFRLLVFGGSQGARFMSDLVPPAVALMPEPLRRRLAIVQQCRPEDMERVTAAYTDLGVAAELQPFFRDLPQRTADSHLIVSRSGASTVAELTVIGRPAIMVPLPGALDQDQKANALVLAGAGGGWMVEQKDMTPERLAADLAGADERPGAARCGGRGVAQMRPSGCRQTPRRCGRACRGRRVCRPDFGSDGMKMGMDIGPVHFVGIGGIGMSGIAEVLVNLGYRVQGSDLSDNANVQRLREKGISIAIGHDAANLGEAKVVVVSSAIKRDNPELKAARERLLPVVRRAEMLAELMRLKQAVAVAGTHGKTTTTSMVAALLDAGGFDPTVINGGIINAYGTNARMGDSDWMVVEADESDGTFIKLPADVALVTNIDPEHLDHYKTFDRVREAFHQFVENVPFYGFAVMCIDHPEVQALIGRIEDRRIVTYGASPQADVRYTDLRIEGGRSVFTATIGDRQGSARRIIENLSIAMPGEHNVQNATGALAVAHHLGVSDKAIAAGMAGFGGVKRRFTRTGAWNGVEIIDDYAHHPIEIAAVLHAARSVARGRVIAVVQPHRYTRLHDLFDQFCTCFNDADIVVVAPVYPAGEAPIEGIDRDHLVEGLRVRGHRDARPLAGPEALAGTIAGVARSGDYVVCLGAGSISQWAYALPDELAKRGGTA